MHSITFLNKSANIPENWDEFTRKQVEFIARLSCVNIEVSKLKSMLAIHCLGIKKHIFNFAGQTYYVPGIKRFFQPWAFRAIAKKKAFWIDPEHLFQVSELFNFMYNVVQPKDDKGIATARRNCYLTKNHFPIIRSRFRKLYGPESELGNSTVAEFIFAENQYDTFVRDPKERNLNKLCCALYRPRKRFYRIRKMLNLADGDPRQPFDDYTEKNHHLFARVPLWLRMAIFLNFEGTRNTFVRQYQNVYSVSDEASEIDEENKGWIPIISSMSGDVFNVSKVLNDNIHTFLAFLDQKIENAKKTATK